MVEWQLRPRRGRRFWCSEQWQEELEQWLCCLYPAICEEGIDHKGATGTADGGSQLVVFQWSPGEG